MTIHTDTKETPFRLMFRQDAVILVEIKQTLDRVLKYSKDANGRLKVENLDFLQEDRKLAHIQRVAYKKRVKKYFNKQVWPREFQVNNVVLRRANGPKKEVNKGKMAPNWEGPFRVTESLGKGAYCLQTIDGENLTRTWNSSHLKRYYVWILWSIPIYFQRWMITHPISYKDILKNRNDGV